MTEEPLSETGDISKGLAMLQNSSSDNRSRTLPGDNCGDVSSSDTETGY